MDYAKISAEDYANKKPYMTFKNRDNRLGIKRDFFERNLKINSVQRNYMLTQPFGGTEDEEFKKRRQD